MLVLVIYLLGMITPLKIVTVWLGVIGTGVWAFMWLAEMLEEREKDREKARYIHQKLKHSYWLLILCWIVPSKDTAYQMLAAYGVQEAYVAATESEDVQRIASKSLKLIEATLDEHLTEGKSND